MCTIIFFCHVHKLETTIFDRNWTRKDIDIFSPLEGSIALQISPQEEDTE